MIKRIYRYLLLITLVVLSLATSVWAIPNLQIYIPGAEYDTATETWIINSYDYELWVIGAHLNVYDVKIALAVPTDGDGTIDVTWLQGQLKDEDGNVVKDLGYLDILNETTDYSSDPYIYFTDEPGTPTMGDGAPLPPHGVFPTSYYEYLIGDFGTGQTVQNYIPGDEWGDEAPGEIKKFYINVHDYTTVDIVAYDHVILSNNKAKYVFSPFSHDGESQIPEPATMLLVGTGLIGLGWTARRKFKK
jgi:hypothetical protein